MVLADRFEAAVSVAFTEGSATVDMLPMVFVQAAVDVLPVTGAGVSLADELRIPLAASDEHAVMAERLETTLGEGPCLTAVSLRRPVVADLEFMATNWPFFYERLVAETPYQSVASFPLQSRQGSYVGELDLYSTSITTLTSTEIAEVEAAVVSPVARVLFRGPFRDELDRLGAPEWFRTDLASARMNVWTAIGMSMERLQLTNKDALALLRGYAYSRDLTLDQVAQLMTETELLQPEELLA